MKKTYLYNAAPFALMDDNSGHRRLWSEREDGDNTSQGKWISSHWPRMGSNRRCCSRETRHSHQGTANEKRRAPEPDNPFYFEMGERAVKHIRFQLTITFLHTTVATCFSCSVGFEPLWHQSAHRWSRRRRDTTTICCGSCHRPHCPHKRGCHSASSTSNWPGLYNVSHEPLLWHPTTRQMALTLSTTQKHAVLPN